MTTISGKSAELSKFDSRSISFVYTFSYQHKFIENQYPALFLEPKFIEDKNNLAYMIPLLFLQQIFIEHMQYAQFF